MSRDERGGGTVLTMGLAMVLLAVTWAGCVLVIWLGQARAAQEAADLAALAGAGAAAERGEACRAAGEAARRNGVELRSCEVRGEWPSFVVEVQVSRGLSPVVAGYPATVTRRATAGSSGTGVGP